MSSTVDNAYEYIYSAIAGGRFRPGDRIPEELISIEMDVSRTPVREAIRRLLAEGLVAFRPNSGANVVSFGPADIAEVFRMRALLEGHAVDRAAARARPADLDHLDALTVSLSHAATAEGDVFTATRLNADFHIRIAEMAESSRLLGMIRGLVRIPPALMHGGSWAERLVDAPGHDEHGRIVAALRAGDGPLARALMEAHILAARPRIAAG